MASIINNDNDRYKLIKGGNDTKDKVFLLSIDEAKKYFNQSNMYNINKRIATRDTEFAKTVNNNGRNLFVDVYSSEFHNGNSLFWLRLPGGTQDATALIDINGVLNDTGISVDETYGIRPAMWVKI